MGQGLVRVGGLAAFLLLSLVSLPAARACDATPPDLVAQQVGGDVVLTWTGALAAGEQWGVYRGDLQVLWDSGFNDSGLATVSTEQFTDVGAIADPAWVYYRVRCEGPGGDGPWSNLGFKARRAFDTVQEGGTGGDFLNIYFVSLPERLGIPDIADSSDANPCLPVAGVGDGIVNADDLLCAWWTSGRGSLMVSGFDADNCRFLDRMVLLETTDCSAPPERITVGSWTAPLQPGQALMVTVSHEVGTAPALNTAVIVGSADPARPCQQIREPYLGPAGRDCSPRQVLLSLPWDGMDREGREILCGRKGRDWVYVNDPVNTKPDTCDQGIFSDVTRKGISVLTFDNVDDDSTTTPDDQFSWSAVSFSTLGRYGFGGVQVDLEPTDALLVSFSLGHGSTSYCPEHR